MPDISDIYRLSPAQPSRQQGVLPIIANLPHSGLGVPAHMFAKLKPEYQAFLPNQDWHLQHLYDFLPELGITCLQATHSRYVSDLNRQLTELKHGSFWKAIIPDQTAYKLPLYEKPLDEDEISAQIDTYYLAYHQKLENLIQETRARFGHALLLDLHSFGDFVDNDIILGNAKGTSCTEQTFSALYDAFERADLDVVQNKVFTGGHITRHYGALPKTEAIQIELRYELYLDKSTLKHAAVPPWQSKQFDLVKNKLQCVLSAFTRKLYPAPQRID